jgi:hypothetical protein
MKMRSLIIGLALLILLPAVSGLAQPNPAAAQIESISDQGFIVLGDKIFVVASDARFFGKDERTPIPFSEFAEGDWVEFSVNENGQIDELWLGSEK